ncbi:MAG: ABC transporter ATP-binding protein [Actinobacteria bacterium]|nr:ABC transporter ATP-binding protein [Actinomycetota bacterium]MCL5736620.1 ABC transporter ATP-binding protein [Actinomycetota bacterium]
MTLLAVSGLDVFYGDLRALSGVELSVAPGEVVAVVGANGAGKSTLLKAIAGTRRARAGSVHFQGQDITGAAAYRRVKMGLALVPEGRRVFPSLTVEENLLVGGHLAKDPKANLSRVYELLPLLVRLRGRMSASLSGGEQQALAIGRALMSQPKLLMIDELSLGLAPVVVERLYATIEAMKQTGDLSIILVDQNIARVMNIADQISLLLEGRVIRHGPTSSFSKSEIVKGYFGA